MNQSRESPEGIFADAGGLWQVGYTGAGTT